jgi:hypothetical protein
MALSLAQSARGRHLMHMVLDAGVLSLSQQILLAASIQLMAG